MQEYSALHRVETSSKVHPASYPLDTGDSLPGVKRQPREADHSIPSSAEVKKVGATTPGLHTSSWRSA
jgi:hypothetical protein